MLGLRFCARAFSSCGKRGPLFIAVRGPLTIAASLVAEHRLQMHRLSSCGSWAQLLRGTWDLPRPGLEPVSPALAGRLSTTAPPGKPCMYLFKLECLFFSDICPGVELLGHMLFIFSSVEQSLWSACPMPGSGRASFNQEEGGSEGFPAEVIFKWRLQG